MPSKEICGFCWGADKARPSASDREGSNRISARLAIPFKRPSTFLLQASRLESFRKLHAACRILFLHSSDFRNEGNLEVKPFTLDDLAERVQTMLELARSI